MSNQKEPPKPIGADLSLLGSGLIPFALSNIGNQKVSRIISQGLAAFLIGKMGWDFFKNIKRKSKYTTIIINENQEWFQYVLRWLFKVKSEYVGSEFEFIDLTRNNSSSSPHEIEASAYLKGDKIKKSEFDFAPLGTSIVKVNGIEIQVILDRPNRDNNNFKWVKDKIILNIKSKKKDDLITVFNQIDELGNVKIEYPRTTVYTYYWDWRATKKIYKIKDVVLPNGEFEKLKKYIGDFLSSREFYEKTNTPYRASCLLHGKTGSGKSTTVEAIATHFGLDVYIISLSEMTDDKFSNAVNQIPDNGILLLEDVDCVMAKDRTTEGTGVSFSGLLNVLDGLSVKEGRITFQSTNHIEKLDSAQIRAGRADYHLEFFNATKEQIIDLSKRFGYNEKDSQVFGEKWVRDDIPMAEIQNRLKQLYNNKKQNETVN